MIEEEILESPEIYSDIDETEVGKEATVGFKSVTIVEHLGLITKVEHEKQSKWGVVEKN